MRGLDKSTLGRYELIREIGHGNMGTVYLSYDPFTERDVAIKVAYPESFNDDKMGRKHRKLFFTEVKASGMLEHPNIVATYDAGIEKDLWYLVMEYVPHASTLHELCRNSEPLPLEKALSIIIQCAGAIDYAHRKGVIHRDIKPKNILLTRNWSVKVADFGIALITQTDVTLTQVQGRVGSPLYMSPEQLLGEPVTNQSDIFSLGVVFYELVTGRSPFVANTLAEIARRVTHQPHLPLREARADIPRILEQIVDRTLKKHPAGRYRTALDLVGDLTLVLENFTSRGESAVKNDKVKLLKGLPFFQAFAEKELQEIIDIGIWQEFKPGEEIISEDTEINAFYILISGNALTRRHDVELETLYPGECFGGVGLPAVGTARTLSVVAKSWVTAMMIRLPLLERTSIGCKMHVYKAMLDSALDRLSRLAEVASLTQVNPLTSP
jgi:serine/threonine protein kinase